MVDLWKLLFKLTGQVSSKRKAIKIGIRDIANYIPEGVTNEFNQRKIRPIT